MSPISSDPASQSLPLLMDQAEADVLAFMAFPRQHWPKLHSTNPLERLNKEVKRRADVVGIFPNQASITRLVGAVLLEQNDEWQLQHRYMTLETMTGLGEEQINSCRVQSKGSLNTRYDDRLKIKIYTTLTDVTKRTKTCRCQGWRWNAVAVRGQKNSLTMGSGL